MIVVIDAWTGEVDLEGTRRLGQLSGTMLDALSGHGESYKVGAPRRYHHEIIDWHRVWRA